MTRRKGGIGRHAGAKRSSRMKTSKYKYKLSKSLNNSKDTDKCIDFSQDKADCTDVADSIGWKATRGIVSRDAKINQLLWEKTTLDKEVKSLEVKVKSSVSKVNRSKSTMHDVVAWSTKKVKTLQSENRKTVMKERTEHNSKLRDCITKFRSQIIYERQDSAAKIKAIEAKCEAAITNTHSKRVNLVKCHMTKIQKERGKNRRYWRR